MVLSGVVTLVLGVVMGALVWTPLYFIAALALVDFALAWAFASGRIKATANVSVRTETVPADDVARVEADPSYNPYARED